MYDIFNDDFVVCSFCVKEKWEVHRMIAGQFCFICNECIDVCNKILFNEDFYDNYDYMDDYYNINEYEDYYIKENPINKEFLDGLMKPSDIYEFLDNLVIGQEEAKKVLSTAVYNHFKKIKFNLDYGYELTKNNILMIGPSGSGKTFLIKSLCKLLNIPIIITDATTLTEAGYVGEDVENILQKLFQESDYDLDKTEIGIVYIDEIDKISKRSGDYSGRDVSGEGVQQALLKLIEGTDCTVCVSGNRRNPNPNFVNINTENILFICGGAFYGLDKIVSERINKSNIGLSSNYLRNVKKTSLMKNLESEDLVKFGIIPELLGRLPIVTQLNELDLNALVDILIHSKNSILNEYNILLSPEDITLTIDPDAAELIAKLAYKKKTGARGLRNIIENLLTNVMYEAPDLDTLKEIIIHKYIFEEGCMGPLLIHEDF